MTGKMWHGGLSIGASCTCDECGAPVTVLYQLGIALFRDAPSRWACRACVLDPARQIGAIDRRGDVLHGDRIARELDGQTAITLHLNATKDSDCGPLPPLPVAYQHVLGALARCARVDAEFSTALAELRERYERAAFFSPKQMLLVQWRLAENGIQHTPGSFTVSIRSEKEVAQLRSLSDWQKRKLAAYLSWQQRGRWGF